MNHEATARAILDALERAGHLRRDIFDDGTKDEPLLALVVGVLEESTFAGSLGQAIRDIDAVHDMEPDAETLALATQALADLKGREREDVAEWAHRLAVQAAEAGEHVQTRTRCEAGDHQNVVHVDAYHQRCETCGAERSYRNGWSHPLPDIEIDGAALDAAVWARRVGEEVEMQHATFTATGGVVMADAEVVPLANGQGMAYPHGIAYAARTDDTVSATIAEGMQNPERWIRYDVQGFLSGSRVLLYEAKNAGRTEDAKAHLEQLRTLVGLPWSDAVAEALRSHLATAESYLTADDGGDT